MTNPLVILSEVKDLMRFFGLKPSERHYGVFIVMTIWFKALSTIQRNRNVSSG